jgi:acetyl-CoA C-acetyltransferase
VSIDPRTPVIVGVGQHVHHAAGVDDALEPLALMEHAVRAAADDAGLDGVPRVDSIRVVSLLSWRYRNPARFLGERLQLAPSELAITANGGNSPQALLNETAHDIQRGALDAAILTGAEAFRTYMRAKREGVVLTWPKAPDDDHPIRHGENLDMNHPGEHQRGLVMPVQFYPLFETALRAQSGRSIAEHEQFLGALWAGLSDVASRNPFAWSQQARSAAEITTVSPHNRMIGAPYTKYMNSNNDVDMGAAILICSLETADRWGVSADRRVFPISGTDCHEHNYVSHRHSFTRTPAIEIGGRRALELAGVGIDDVAIIDLYSCFPSAVQLGAASLGLSLDRQWSRTGGLPFAGGPWNNYSMHAIAAVVSGLRQNPDEHGLVWANGGYATKHSFGVYATSPPPDGFRHDRPQEQVDVLPRRQLVEPPECAGPATIEAYTVMHDRHNVPERAIAACLLSDGRRAWGISAEKAIASALTSGEWVGTEVALDASGTLLLRD